MKPATKKPVAKKPSTPQQRAERRAKRWKKTGVSQSTVQWMRDNFML
jgi:hypothetical protein